MDRAELRGWAAARGDRIERRPLTMQVFDSSDGIASGAQPWHLGSARREVARRPIVVQDRKRRRGGRPRQPAAQRTSAARAHRANRRGSRALRRGDRLGIDAAAVAGARSADRLHGAEPRRAGEDAVSLSARRSRGSLAGRRHSAPSVLQRSAARRLSLPRHREQQRRRLERRGRERRVFDRADVLSDSLVRRCSVSPPPPSCCRCCTCCVRDRSKRA